MCQAGTINWAWCFTKPGLQGRGGAAMFRLHRDMVSFGSEQQEGAWKSHDNLRQAPESWEGCPGLAWDTTCLAASRAIVEGGTCSVVHQSNARTTHMHLAGETVLPHLLVLSSPGSLLCRW